MESLEITDLKVVPCVNSRFIAPSRVTFKQNGVQRTWDYIKVHDAVAILIFNTTRQAFILVKQFRPALFMNINSKANNENISKVTTEEENVKISAPYEKGVSYELCAGIVDQQRSLIEIAKSEILEETGYELAIDNIQKLFTDRKVGALGSSCTIFYAEVTDDMKVAEGGGLQAEGEFIDLFYLPLVDAKDFVFSEAYSKPAGLIAAFCWYFMVNQENKST